MPGTGTDQSVDALPRRRRMLVLAICCMSLLIVSLDITALNVALPSLGRELNADVSGLQWTVDAYTLVLASFLMLSGSMADRLGRRRVFTTGLVIFTTGSLLCALAPGLGWLVGFRMLQALGGSMLNPVAMSIIRNTFHDPKELARAIGMWGGVVGISMAAGPIVGGALVQAFDWRAVFWINIPVGITALVLTRRFVPESRAPRARRIDPVGQLLVILLLGSLTFGIIEGGRGEWTSAPIVGCFLVAALSLPALVWYESRRFEPLLDPRFFRSAPFSGASAIAVSAFAALSGFLFLNTLYLQDQRQLSALEAGTYLLPMAGVTLVLAPVSGWLINRVGARLPLLLAGSALTASGLMFAGWQAESDNARLFTAYVLFGIGFGLVNAPITNTAVTGMPRAQAGVAAGIASTSRQVGSALGVAMVGTALAAGSMRTGWWIITVCAVLVLVIGLLTSGPWAQASAGRAAERLAASGQRPGNH
ncbi:MULTISPECIES: MFS transporter [Streptomyces]|jgi:EmrB/QacA subfamily drug resistance transporter|uniref:MFS transporter n=1 Tax=Streptomyces TaxID=1883 RepID=UPI001907DAB5|nr:MULTISPECIES: MFS transporter [unclassified Streptomyces]MCU4745992.1 MFS transporter [Streptomyces sp. G-5]QQN76325.1 MFS transporter [Streptomyces sp. XC 2026]